MQLFENIETLVLKGNNFSNKSVLFNVNMIFTYLGKMNKLKSLNLSRNQLC